MNAAQQFSDVPAISEFDPHAVAWQFDAIKAIRTEYDYSLGVHQVLASGAVGSAKSLWGAHMAITHCLAFPGAHCGIGRLTLPDLKETLLDTILDHLADDVKFFHHQQKGVIVLSNGSKISCHSWHDKKFKKFRSKKFSMFIFEELTENDTPEAYDAVFMRMGRLPHVHENVMISLTNPDDPEHWAYKKIIKPAEAGHPQKHVFYSKTLDNTFLPESYYETLLEDLDPKMALRMLEGLWVSISGENIYYNYDMARNYVDAHYKVDCTLPIRMGWDFNIGEGKPMSMCFAQNFGPTFHFFNEAIIYSARTIEVLEDIATRGLLDHPTHYIVHGDSNGSSNDTRGFLSDYDIIDKFLANYVTGDGRHLSYEFQIPKANPNVRRRHNYMNGSMLNVKNQNRFMVYKDCPVLHEGLTLTKLKKGGNYIEDDSKYYQHVTTGAGYLVHYVKENLDLKKQGTVYL